MSDDTRNDQLNDALAALASSLVQYIGDTGPWSDSGGDETDVAALELFRRRQRLQIARIVELLEQRRATVELGQYPTEFTDLHFLSLENLYPRLIADERAIVSRLEAAMGEVGDDEEAAGLLGSALAEEQVTLAELKALAG